MSRLAIFWVMQLVFLLFFFAELGLVGSIWLRGSVPGLSPEASWPRKLWAIVVDSWDFLFSRRLWRALGVLIRDGLLHSRLAREDRLRWGGHLAAFGAFFFLGLLSVVTGFATEILIHFFGWHNAFTDTLANPDHPVTALLNELLGLVLLVGVAFLLYRRYIQKPAQLRALAEDHLVVILIALIVASGFKLEAFRLLAEGVPLRTEGIWGFGGAGFAWLIRPLHLPWKALHYWLFFGHVVLCDLLLIYLPFSKFFHVLASPLILAINSLEEA